MKKLAMQGKSIYSLAIIVSIFLTLPMAWAQPNTKDVIHFSFAAPAKGGGAYWEYTCERVSELIDKATKGRLEVTVHQNLIRPADIINAVRDRRVDMGVQVPAYRAEMALFDYLALPCIPYDSFDKMHPKLKHIFAESARKDFDVVMLGYGYFPVQCILSKEPLLTLDELTKAKIRTVGLWATKLLKSAGGNPVVIPKHEVYTSLQRGVVDGAMSSVMGFWGDKSYEVAKYIDMWPMGNAGLMWIINKDAWRELSGDVQGSLLKLFSDVEMKTYYGSRNDHLEFVDMLIERGCKVIKPSKKEIDEFVSYAPPLVQQWKKMVGPQSAEIISVVNNVLGTNY